MSSGKVSAAALLEAAHLVEAMLAFRDDLRPALAAAKVRIAVMAPTEFTTDIPEHADLEPREHWNLRARGLGATRQRPCVSCGEENLLTLAGDPYRGENILIHEFAHAIHELGLRSVDHSFDARLRAAFLQAKQDDLWKDTYAATNPAEYWAEGVQSWFDCNRTGDSQHNQIGTREALKSHDPALAKLLMSTFGDSEWRYRLPDQRREQPHLAEFDRASRGAFQWPEELQRWKRRQAANK